LHEAVAVQPPVALQQQFGDNHHLLGIISHARGRLVVADGILRRPRQEAVETREQSLHEITWQQLRRHAERVANRKAVERALCTVECRTHDGPQFKRLVVQIELDMQAEMGGVKQAGHMLHDDAIGVARDVATEQE
jgi:hypothetical protein